MLKQWATRRRVPSNRERVRRRPACRLRVEPLEARLVLSVDMVLRWNEILWGTLETANPVGPFATRAAAMVQAAVYDAVNSIDGTHTPYLSMIPAPSGASEDAATAQAAHDTLVGLFPTQATALDLQLKASLQGITDSDSKAAGILVGQTAAQNVLAARAQDGSDKVVDYTPGTDPGNWQPTPPAYGPPVAPQWPQVIPFCLQSGSQFRPGPPPALTSAEYTAAFNLTKDLGSFTSTSRTADQTEAALFWQGVYVTPNTFLSMLNQVAEQLAVTRGNSLVDNARLLALLDLTFADGFIGCWDAKYTYNLWRPVTAIRAADTDGNPDTEADPNWAPLFATPVHPSYPSGHSTIMGGFATVLASYFGTDAIPFSVSYAGFPGVTRSYDSFTAAANECGLARIWAGIHWSFDIAAGDALGRSVGTYVVQNFLLPRGGAPVPPGHGSIGLTGFGATGHAVPGSANLQIVTGPTDLSRGKSFVYPGSAEATSNSAASDNSEIIRVHSAAAQAASNGSSVDDVFSSASSWDHVDWAG
jgi:membrane-associated phospholipid phosphatase